MLEKIDLRNIPWPNARTIIQAVCWIILFLWLLVLDIASADRGYTYQIRYASNSIHHWEIKNEILEVYDKLTYRVDEEYHYEILSQGIKEFEIRDNFTASLNQHQILITIGDGKGIVVEGSFQQRCQAEIKRKSLLLTLLGK